MDASTTPLADGATDKGGADGAEAPDVGAAGTADVGAAGAAGEAGAAGGGAARLVWPEWLHAWNDMNEPSVSLGLSLTLTPTRAIGSSSRRIPKPRALNPTLILP